MSELSRPLAGKVLVTGASGFIGGRLRELLSSHGAEVVALVRPGSPPARAGRAVQVDYRDRAGLRAVIERERPDYVFHVAGATKGVSLDDFRRGNVMPTENLIGAVAEAHPGVRRFLHVSSLTAYGPSNAGPPLTETSPRRPVEHYGQSKLEAERVVEAMGDRLAWTIVRPPTVYGPGEVDLFTLFQSVSRGVSLFFGNRDKRTSAVYVDDLIDGMVTAVQSEQTRGKGYFLCDGVGYTWGEIQAKIVQARGRRTFDVNLPRFLVPAAGLAGELVTAVDKKPRLFNRQKAIMDAQEAWLCSHAAAARDFGYQPRVALAEGIARAYRWYRDNGWL